MGATFSVETGTGMTGRAGRRSLSGCDAVRVQSSVRRTMVRPGGAAIETIGIIGNYGNRNLGDEATLATIVHHVRRRRPQSRIVGLSFDPADTRVRHGIEAVPSRRPRRGATARRPAPDGGTMRESNFLGRLRRHVAVRVRRNRLLHGMARRVMAAGRWVADALGEVVLVRASLRDLKGIDLLIVGGGGQLTDETYPPLLLRWSVLARLKGARVIVLNVGAGPLDSPGNRLRIRAVLRLADYSSFRDKRSKRLIEAIGVAHPGPVVSDIVYSLPVADALRRGSHGTGPRVVGVNVFPRKDARYVADGDSDAYQAYLVTLGGLVVWLLRSGYVVRLFPTQLRADPPAIADLKKTIHDDIQGFGHRLVEARIATVADLVSQISTTDLVVATRFHGIVVSFLLGKPVLVLGDEPKMDDLADDMGLSDYRLSLDRFDVESTIERFKSLEANREALADRIRRRVDEHRRALDSQLDSLLGDCRGERRR